MLFLLFLPIVAGALSTLLSGDLKMASSSPFQPPPYVFAIVWPILYLAMGYSAYRVSLKGPVPSVFFLQLFLNVIWPVLFTRVGVSAALVDILLLDVAVLFTATQFYQIDRPASYLLIPYMLWLSFATFLNATALPD